MITENLATKVELLEELMAIREIRKKKSLIGRLQFSMFIWDTTKR
jgi:hypothetical protein